MSPRLLALLLLTVLALAFVASADKPWAWNAKQAKVDPQSKSMMRNFNKYVRKWYPNVSINKWAVATATATASSPYYHVKLLHGGTLDDKVRIPLGSKPDTGDDQRLTVLDPVSGREHDFWRAVYDESTGRISQATAGNSFPIGSVSEYNFRAPGSNAAGVPLRRGLVTCEAIKKGKLSETMQFSMPYVGHGDPRYPAIENFPSSNLLPGFVDGTWLRLDPKVNVKKLKIPKWQKVIAATLQNHGMILRDTGGSLGIYGRNPVNEGLKWKKCGLTGLNAGFSTKFPWHRLQVLVPPPGELVDPNDE